jgi:hypothetical protein
MRIGETANQRDDKLAFLIAGKILQAVLTFFMSAESQLLTTRALNINDFLISGKIF